VERTLLSAAVDFDVEVAVAVDVEVNAAPIAFLSAVILSGAGTSQSEAPAESKDPYIFNAAKDDSGSSLRSQGLEQAAAGLSAPRTLIFHHQRTVSPITDTPNAKVQK
jgi:hypothetical protein